jgi:TonB family protein
MARPIPEPYRQPLFGRLDALFRRCLIGSSVIGFAVLVAVMVAPVREKKAATVEEMPERLARLIIEKPKPRPVELPKAPLAKAETVTVNEPEETPAPAPAHEITPDPPKRKPRPVTRPDVKKPDPDAGKAGRERAKKEVTEKLAKTTEKVETALADLSAALATSTNEPSKAPPRNRRSRRVRSGRSASDVNVAVATRTSGASADAAGSTLEGSLVAIESVDAYDPATGELAATGSGSGVGEHRSSASLLAVVRKYAPGIQYCYENELKRDQGLEGKIVVALTVSASGEVLGVELVTDTLDRSALNSCALAQIREWKFPPIEEGQVTFRVPFVFTPPKQ